MPVDVPQGHWLRNGEQAPTDATSPSPAATILMVFIRWREAFSSRKMQSLQSRERQRCIIFEVQSLLIILHSKLAISYGSLQYDLALHELKRMEKRCPSRGNVHIQASSPSNRS
jgi:hypothetical protein